jgi:AraC-like DNA-binding protein
MKSIFLLKKPSRLLDPFIQAFWYAEGEPDQRLWRVLPNGVVEWIFNISDSPHLVIDNENPEKFEFFRRSWVAGFQNSYLNIMSPGETKLFGVRFKPGGAYPFLRFPLDEISDQVVDIEHILSNPFKFIPDHLFSVSTVEQGFIFLENTIVKLIDETTFDEIVPYVIRQLPSRPIKAVALDVGISHKQLIHRFLKKVGTSPKKLEQIIKFQRSIQKMTTNPEINLANLAYDLGYYDQAHFNHIFKKFSGVSPISYLEHRTSDPNQLFL